MQNSELVGPGSVIPRARRSTNSYERIKGIRGKEEEEDTIDETNIGPERFRTPAFHTAQTYLIIEPVQLGHKEIVEDGQMGGGSSKRVAPGRQDVADQLPKLVMQRARLPDMRQLPVCVRCMAGEHSKKSINSTLDDGME